MDNIDDFAKWTRGNWFNLTEGDTSAELTYRDLNIMSLGLPEEVGEVLALLKRQVRDGKFEMASSTRLP